MKKEIFQESETVELKKSTSELKEAIISIAAILNKNNKGKLYFGVKNDGTIIGQDIGEKTIRDISKTISDNIEPKIYPKINKIKINGKTCIYIEFFGNNPPYYAYGRGYIRTADENKQLSAQELENIILKKYTGRLRWDAEICKEATIEDVSVVKIRSFLKTAQLKYDSLENALKKLRIVHDGKLLNTAVMLFGKKPQSFFPNAKLRCAVFGTMDTSFPIDMKDFEGDLFYLIEKAEEYILKNIHIGMKIEGLKRIDIPEINQEAMREAIINAFCHRDYYEYDSVNIAIFKDRVEIRNPGLLYGGLTIEKIKTEMISERRNELIAELFHRVHYIEKWGRGIRLILSKEPDAEFKEVGTHFIVVFKRKEISASPSEGVNEGVSEGVDALFDYIKNNPGNRTPQFEEALSVPVKTIERWLKKLKDEQRIEFRGAPKTGGYYIKK